MGRLKDPPALLEGLDDDRPRKGNYASSLDTCSEFLLPHFPTPEQSSAETNLVPRLVLSPQS